MTEMPEAALATANGSLADAGKPAKKLSATEKRKLREKQKKAEKRKEREARAQRVALGDTKQEDGSTPAVEIEYVSAPHEYEDLLETSSAAADEAPEASRPSGFSAAAEPEEDASETLGLGSTIGLGGAGLGATPQGGSDWEGLGSTPGLGAAATPDPGSTPVIGGAVFRKASDDAVKASFLGEFSPSQSARACPSTPAHSATPPTMPESPVQGTDRAQAVILADMLAAHEIQAENPYADFQRIFNHFTSAEELTGSKREAEKPRGKEDEDMEEAPKPKEPAGDAEGSDADSEGAAAADEEALSKKKRKLEARLKIAELKQTCARPDVVEVWDVTAQDPKLLVYLKAYRNSVPVPRHWSQKRKYLQGKRGIEKPPFKLPTFIEATGIGEMRQAYHEKEENKKLKSKQRERMQPKMGKLDIDYQVLHDAFFKFQTKPSLTVMGDLYYEGKEFEARVKASKPGVLSEDLRGALGMGGTTPPPWLINMQRYGPPPSYPDLKVSGLNAPIPPGASFGYQPGGWGKPPVDEHGNPLYGDVFGQYAVDSDDEMVDKTTHWGDLDSEEEEEESDMEEDEEQVEVDTESLADGLTSVISGYSSLPSGLETPEALDLRKAKAGGAGAGAGERPLYQVLEQQPAQLQTGQLMGTDHTYVVPPGGDQGARRAANTRKLEALRRESGGDMEVAIDPEELEGLDDVAVRALYEQRLEEERARHSREDFSEMVAQKAAQQKRKAAQKESTKAKKKEKDSFQF